jgi:hypothetical protein
MTTDNPTRRQFLQVGGACGVCALCGGLARAGETGEYDFEKLTYCCFECDPEKCPTLKATLEDDVEYKEKTAVEWSKRYEREVSADEVFCYGCRVPEDKMSLLVKRCDVRQCVLDKGLVSCAHCPDLATCQRNLWTSFPDFRKRVLEIQKKVLAG